MNANRQLSRSYEISTKVGELYRKRTKLAQEHFGERLGARARFAGSAAFGRTPAARMMPAEFDPAQFIGAAPPETGA